MMDPLNRQHSEAERSGAVSPRAPEKELRWACDDHLSFGTLDHQVELTILGNSDMFFFPLVWFELLGIIWSLLLFCLLVVR